MCICCDIFLLLRGKKSEYLGTNEIRINDCTSISARSERYVRIQTSVLLVIVMLSALILEPKGTVTNNRILDSNAQKQEVTVIGRGITKGLEISLMITYWNKPIQGNMENKSQLMYYYCEGNGIISTMDDSKETAIIIEYGIGRMIGHKTVWRGFAFYWTSCGRLAALNNSIGVFETDVDNVSLNVNHKVWEWS